MYLGNFRNASKMPLLAKLLHADHEVLTIIKIFKKLTYRALTLRSEGILSKAVHLVACVAGVERGRG